MQNHLQNHPKGQICPILTVGWPMLSGFTVEDWKSDFYDSSRLKIGLFSYFFRLWDYALACVEIVVVCHVL